MRQKYVLFLAAVAALASCVKENTLVPEQTSDNLVTITAVSADTKTVLDGTDVVWEDGDAIKVVFNSATETYETEFTTSLDKNATTAKFKGTLDPEVTVDACGETGYAVYPSKRSDGQDINIIDGKLIFFVDKEQYGTILSKKNLSFAEVSLAAIEQNSATDANFNNALSLVKITVPAGVRSVVLESASTMLTGLGTFSFVDGEILYIPDNVSGNRLVTLKKDAEGTTDLDPAKPYYVHVFPGQHDALTIKVNGDCFSYSKTLPFTFVASKYHNLNIANIFSVETLEYAASPFGDVVNVPVKTTLDDYTVTVPAEASWIVPPTKGAFRQDVVSLTVRENTGTDVRDATVTISDGAGHSYDITISQKTYDADLLDMELKESYTKSSQNQTGTLKVEETDDATKGVYKVTICGVSTYADYKVPILTVHDGDNDYEFTVANEYAKLTYTGDGSLFLGGAGISDYEAVKSLGAAVLSSAEEALVGNYDEAWTYFGSPNVSAKGMTISASPEALYGQLYVKCLTDNGYSFTGYASYNEGTKILTVNVGKQYHFTFNKSSGEVILTLNVNDDGSLSFDSWADAYGNKVTNYTATKVVDEPETPGDESSLNGTWDQSVTVGTGTANATVTLTVDGDQVTLTDFIYAGTIVTGTLSGNTITLSSGQSISTMTGPLTSDIVLTISADEKTITAPDFQIGGWVDVTGYTATKPATLDGVWNQSVTVGTGTANATVTLTVDDDLVTLTNFIYAGTVVTGTLSGNTITLASGQSISTMTGPLTSNLVLTISGDKKTITAPDFQIGGWVDVTGYTATKQ